MTQKIEQINGFEYTHERHNFNGQWVFLWRFKPVGQPVWCPFILPVGNAKKADVVRLLRNSEAADIHYKTWLERASDVENAELELSRARAHLERISDPDWGGSGSNPDKDARMTRQAHSDVESAARNLENAIRIRSQITK
ncbi:MULTISPECIES: hypothetical protein [Enterobacteriaceae]|uniref:hypothetical protein n=1 Tax=Enterobacteriaceae TaxID=543 RepID=UPI000934C853|nr:MULTISPECIES: hypothetical protein [Enterobacteriaceae]ELO3239295.1 hypothetical protein [Escherichia coli]MCE0533260.1 hypothetical protein [Escherichia coli]MCE0549677.1 hypothetical protein [Escherichia coli]MCL0901713.1 hypothetical protein [Escherichia coli]MEB5960542.1 hypothetical protein [Enterobacter sichuanensis]